MTSPNPNLMSRRAFMKKGVKYMMSLLGAGLIGSYPFFGERLWYHTKSISLTVPNLPEAFKGWKIVQFSDVHFGFYYGVKELSRVVARINRLEPDLIFFTGDLVQTKYKWPELTIPLLKKLNAPRGGKWAVLGNHDYMTRSKVIDALEQSQFNVLINQNGYVESGGQRLYIAGIDDVMYGDYRIEASVQHLSPQDCVLFLAHEPDIADESCNYNINAQFSGHSHGGQIRIPFYGPLILNKLAERYEDGLYEVGENKMPLYVNRGIGTANLPIRLFCRPEITVFHLS